MVKIESEAKKVKKSVKMEDETKKIAKKRKSVETSAKEDEIVKPVEKKLKIKDEEIKTEKRKKPDHVDKKKFDGKNGKNKPYSDARAMAAASDKPQLSQKELKEERRKKKLSTNYQISVDIKKIWETLRKAETTEEIRQKLCRTLHEHVKGNVKNMAMAHDTVRVIECLMQYGNENQRATIFNELTDGLVELSKSKYGRFLLIKMLNYGTKEQKDQVISQFKGFSVKLIKHSFACKVIDTIFNEHASTNQRNQMLAEFYDFKSGILMDQVPKSLSDVLKAQSQSKETIMENIKNILNTCIEKSILMFSIVHRVFHEYFLNCDQKSKSEMIEALSEQLVHIIHTKDGAEVAKQCVWFSTAKQRKGILKGLKSFLLKISSEEHGHLVLISIFDSVDDTKLVSKIVLDELFRSIEELLQNDYGRKVVSYLIAPRDKRFFYKDYNKRLEGGDASETSKKEKKIRYDELIQYSIKYLAEYLNKNLEKCLRNGPISVMVPLIINKLENSDETFSKLANLLLSTPYAKSESTGDKKKKEEEKGEEKKEESSNEHLIENSVSHLALKHVFINDKDFEVKNLTTLTETLLAHENSSMLKSWCECNRGCFLIIAMIESCGVETQKKIKKILDGLDLVKFSFAGAKVLRKKIDEIK